MREKEKGEGKGEEKWDPPGLVLPAQYLPANAPRASNEAGCLLLIERIPVSRLQTRSRGNLGPVSLMQKHGYTLLEKPWMGGIEEHEGRKRRKRKRFLLTRSVAANAPHFIAGNT